MVKKSMGVAGVLAIVCLLILSGCGHPWFKTRWPWEEKPDPNQRPVITTSDEEIIYPGSLSWVPLINDCMKAGGTRNECIAALPPEELAKLEAWEARRRIRK